MCVFIVINIASIPFVKYKNGLVSNIQSFKSCMLNLSTMCKNYTSKGYIHSIFCIIIFSNMCMIFSDLLSPIVLLIAFLISLPVCFGIMAYYEDKKEREAKARIIVYGTLLIYALFKSCKRISNNSAKKCP